MLLWDFRCERLSESEPPSLVQILMPLRESSPIREY